mgnify:CR=1 FL=1
MTTPSGGSGARVDISLNSKAAIKQYDQLIAKTKEYMLVLSRATGKSVADLGPKVASAEARKAILEGDAKGNRYKSAKALYGTSLPSDVGREVVKRRKEEEDAWRERITANRDRRRKAILDHRATVQAEQDAQLKAEEEARKKSEKVENAEEKKKEQKRQKRNANARKRRAARRRAEERLQATADKSLESGQGMLNIQKDLGIQAGLNTAGVYKQRASLEKLISTQAQRKILGEQVVQNIRRQIVEMQRLGAEVAKTSQRMVFMQGSSVGAQVGIRKLSSAAQGAMLGMSALNGDVMGLAFSLIFLQFSGFLPISLGIAAATVGMVGLVKATKSVIKNLEEKQIKKFGGAFFLATGSIHASEIATQRSTKAVEDLSLKQEHELSLINALNKAQATLLTNGIEPTNKALAVARNAWLVATAGNMEAEEAMDAMLQTTVKYMRDGGDIVSFVDQQGRSFKAFGDMAANALFMLNETSAMTDVTVRDVMKVVDEHNVSLSTLRDEYVTALETAMDFNGGMGTLGTTVGNLHEGLSETIGLLDSLSLGSKLSAEQLDASNEALGGVGTTLEPNGKINRALETARDRLKEVAGSSKGVNEVLAEFNQQASHMGIPESNLKNLQHFADVMADLRHQIDLSAEGMIHLGETIKTGVKYDQSIVDNYIQPIDALSETGSRGNITINVNVSDNVVQNDQELADQISSVVSRNTRPLWGLGGAGAG